MTSSQSIFNKLINVRDPLTGLCWNVVHNDSLIVKVNCSSRFVFTSSGKIYHFESKRCLHAVVMETGNTSIEEDGGGKKTEDNSTLKAENNATLSVGDTEVTQIRLTNECNDVSAIFRIQDQSILNVFTHKCIEQMDPENPKEGALLVLRTGCEGLKERGGESYHLL